MSILKIIKADVYNAHIGDTIVCQDYREYVPEKSHNGGCYGYEDRYTYVGRGMWQHEEYATGCGDICEFPDARIITTKKVVEMALHYLNNNCDVYFN